LLTLAKAARAPVGFGDGIASKSRRG